MDKYSTKFIKDMNILVSKSNNRLYNSQAVARLLDLEEKTDLKEQCHDIVNYLSSKRGTNPVIDRLLSNFDDSALSEHVVDEDICKTLVNVLYQLFNPESFPDKAPIRITNKRYYSLIDKYKDGSITKKEKKILHNALNIKYCHCVKSLFIKESFDTFIKGNNKKDDKYNRYAICMSSIYKNRNIKPPFKVSYSCREKYNWYK